MDALVTANPADLAEMDVERFHKLAFAIYHVVIIPSKAKS